MTSNIRKVQKGIDSGFKAATPGQLAKYVSDEYCRIAQDQLNEKDVSTKRRDLLNIVETYVDNLKQPGIIEYLMTLHAHDTKAVVREFYRAQVKNNHQQQCLVFLLIRATDRQLMDEIYKDSKNCSDFQIKEIKRLEKVMKMYQEGYDILQEHIDGILNDPFWDETGFPRPEIEPVIKPLPPHSGGSKLLD
jgi:soluble cytochrome b562